MRKLLLGTTALVAATALTAPAISAERLQLTLRGYHVGGIAYTDADYDFGEHDVGGGSFYSGGGINDYNEINFGSDSEIHFRAMTTLDNGLEIAFFAELELEGDDSSDHTEFYASDIIDEVYIQFTGGFGRVQFGQNDGAMFQHHVTAPNVFVGHGVNQPDVRMDPFRFLGAPGTVFSGPASGNIWGNPIDTYAHFTGDNIKLTYFTPEMNGFQFGVSYTPNPCKNPPGYCTWAVFEEFGRNFWEASFVWAISMDNVMIGLSGGYGQGESGASGDEPTEWSLGADASFGGFTIGGSYSEKDIWGTGEDQEHFDVGITYETGPWGFGLQYGDADGNLYGWENSPCSYSCNAGDEAESWLVGVTYDYGPGMQFGIGLQTLDVEDKWFGDSGDILGWEGFDGTSVFIENSITF